MSETKIYLELSNEIEQLLDDNRIFIEDILQNADINARVIYDIPPYQIEEGTRGIRPIIIGAAISMTALSVSSAISQVLDTIYEKPYFVEVCEPQELRDADGKILLDQNGHPIFKCIPHPQLIPPRAENQSNQLEFSSDGNSFLIKIGLEEDQISE